MRSDDTTDSLQRFLQRRVFQEHEVIFREGDQASCAYVVRSGSVFIVKENGPKVALLTTLVANQIFGELALLDERPRSATAIAAETTELLIVTTDQFKAKMDQLDGFMRYLVTYLTERIYDLSERVEE